MTGDVRHYPAIFSVTKSIKNQQKLEGAQRVHIFAKWICNTVMTNEWSLCWPMPWRHRCTACCGNAGKPPLRSWTWLYDQKANKTTFPTVYCPYGNSVNFSRRTIRHSAYSNEWYWVLTDTQTDTQTHKSENSISLANIIIWRCAITYLYHRIEQVSMCCLVIYHLFMIVAILTCYFRYVYNR